MNKMRAVVVDPNAPGHVTLAEIDPPSPAPSEAVVKVMATSLNLGEVRYATTYEPGTLIGWDFAGTVQWAAADGSGPPAGTPVVGMVRRGAWAELVAVPTSMIAEIPEHVSFAQAATLPVAGLTALYVLEHAGSLLERNALVTGANGGVGMFAVQLAKLMGANAVGVVRREQYVDLVRGWGADEVVVSEDAGAARDFGPYHLVAEAVGGATLGNCIAMLAPDGVCVSFGASAGIKTTLDIPSFYAGQRLSVYGFLLFNEFGRKPASDGLARLCKLVADDRLKIQISVEEKWDKIGQVAKDLWERRIAGKAVVHVG